MVPILKITVSLLLLLKGNIYLASYHKLKVEGHFSSESICSEVKLVESFICLCIVEIRIAFVIEKALC